MRSTLLLSLLLSCIQAWCFDFSKNEHSLFDIADQILVDTTGKITELSHLNNPIVYNVDESFWSKDSSSYWIHFKLPPNTSKNQKWVVEVYDIRVQTLKLFFKQRGEWESSHQSWLEPFRNRKYHLLNPTLDLPLSKTDSTEFYLRLQSQSAPGMTIMLRTQEKFTNYAIDEYYLLGFFYGFLVIIALYNLTLFFYLKELNHLLLCIYIIASIFFSFQEVAIGFKYLWPNHPNWNDWIDYFWSPLFFLLSYTVYALDFLKIEELSRKLYRGLWLVSIFLIFFDCIEFFLPFNIAFDNFYFVPFLFIFASAIYAYRKGKTYARLFIIGNGLVFASMVIRLLRNNDFIDHTIFTVYSFEFAIAVEIIILSLALADKIKFLKDEKDQTREAYILQLQENQALQSKVNRELEEQVRRRTVQLEEKANQLDKANTELQDLTDKLNQMNSKLDYDNWKLSKDINAQTMERLSGKGVKYETFMEVFPDDLTCLRFLRDLKWKDDFSCIKCNYEKYKEVDTDFSRKCSKCGHIESVTANTIFHKIRFPISKAFYISHVVFYNIEISNEQLAKALELNASSSSRFRKKITSLKIENRISWETFLLKGTQAI